MTERVRIGTQLLGQADEQPVTPVPQQGADGTLLAVVPIPGTGTSLAIVGYPVAGPGVAPDEAVAPEGTASGRGCCSTTSSAGCGPTGARSS